MEFLDPKEQVISLEITPHGRYLLSTGKFKPATYAFYDDDIIYDSGFAKTDGELQNEIEPRIQENTPRLSAQANFRAAEVAVFSSAPNVKDDLMPGVLSDKTNQFKMQETPNTSYVLQYPLGTSAYNSDKLPAWNINFVKGTLEFASSNITGSKVPIVNVPQLESNIEHVLNRYPQNFEDEAYAVDQKLSKENIDAEIYDDTIIFEDGSKIIYEKDFLFLQLEEANSEFLKDNFELEVFEIVNVTGSSQFADANEEVLKKLLFLKNEFDPSNEQNVEYYFDISMDNDISSHEYCNLVKGRNKVVNIFADKTFVCPERKWDWKDLSVAADIYNTGENADSGEVC